MSCDVGEVTESLENKLCYDYHYELCSFSKLSVSSPTSQLILILRAFRHFTYVTAHSPTLLSLLLGHRIFTYVTWRAHGVNNIVIGHLRKNYLWGKQKTTITNGNNISRIYWKYLINSLSAGINRISLSVILWYFSDLEHKSTQMYSYWPRLFNIRQL